MFEKKTLDKSFVRVYAENSSALLQKIESDASGWVAFQLPLQKFYTVKISKYGYVTKIITVDAAMPKSLEKGDYYFEFSVDLFEEIEGLDVSLLKEPVAKIFFNTFTKKFDYDYNYTAKINNDVKKLYSNYQLLKKQGKVQVFEKTEETKTEVFPDTVKNADVKADTPKKPSVIFSVEVLSSSEQIPKNSSLLKGIVNAKEYFEDELYKYYIGEYATSREAEKMKEDILGFFPTARIIAFKEGKKIPLEEATQK